MEYRSELSPLLTNLVEIVTEQAQALSAEGVDAEQFRGAVEHMRTALDAIGRAGFAQLAHACEMSADRVQWRGTVCRFKQDAPKWWMTWWGKVEVSRRLYQPDRGGASVIPLDQRCGMVDRFLTADLERATVLLGARLVPGEIEESLAALLPEPVVSDVEKDVLAVLSPDGSFVDEIAMACRIPVSEALSSLTMLELKGLVRQYSGKRFAPR